jgi:predicted nucleic acid-binding protein
VAKDEPRRTALDSSVIVAGLLPWHEKHRPARAALARLLRVGGSRRSVVVPFSALVESYSVMTRLPAPHRLNAADAYALLGGAFRDRAAVASPRTEGVWEFLTAQRDAGVYGGAVYDAVILAAAMRGGARRLLTFNRQHFERLRPEGIEILEPGI